MGARKKSFRSSDWLRCLASALRWRGAMGITTCGNANLQIAQRKFQAAVLGMIVVPDRERDIDGIPGQELDLLETLGHVPAQSVKRDFAPEIRSQASALHFANGRCPVAAPNSRSVRVTARRGHSRRRRSIFNLGRLPGSELQLYMLFLQNPGSSYQLCSMRGEHRLGIRHAIRFQHLQSLIQFRSHVTQIELTIQFEYRVDVRQSKAGARELV